MDSKERFIKAFLITAALTANTVLAQFTITGRVWGPIVPGSEERYAYSTVLTFATPLGSEGESLAARTWETHPSGWHTLSGREGAYTFGVVGPGHFMRPLIITNQFMAPGDHFDRHVAPDSWYAVLKEQHWDPRPTEAYLQTFVAQGTSITHVGFKLAHDGIDGGGPLAQTFLVSIHQVSGAEPTAWKQIGPAVPVLNVNAGGELNIRYAACWNSGEVPTDVGQLYAVHIRPEDGGGFQGYWHDDVYPGGACYRVLGGKAESTTTDLWCYVAGDGDGLLIPFNKRVQREFHDLTKWGSRWSQTYKAMGRGLASVTLYAAVSTEQPPMRLQRTWIRLRRSGPDGPIIGTPKIAVGCNTATAESGNIGAVFAPGEVDLEPGQTYAIEFEAFGPHRGFNPWMKNPRDSYDNGTAYFVGTDRKDYDLDMIVVEYANLPDGDWTQKVHADNLLKNGDMQQGSFDPDNRDAGGPEHWKRFKIDPGTTHWYVAGDTPGDRPRFAGNTAMTSESKETRNKKDKPGESGTAGESGTVLFTRDPSQSANRVAAIVGGSINGKTVDGGYVQQVTGLKRSETYRLSGHVRSTWPVDEKHRVLIGLDPTGQTDNPDAPTVTYATLPRAHGIFEKYTSPPTRPAADTISVWLRARATATHNQPFLADFDEFTFNQVVTGAPGSD